MPSTVAGWSRPLGLRKGPENPPALASEVSRRQHRPLRKHPNHLATILGRQSRSCQWLANFRRQVPRSLGETLVDDYGWLRDKPNPEVRAYLDHDLEDIRQKVRKQLKDYLQSFLEQFRPLMNNEMADSSSPELQDMLELAFERYFDDHSLLGTPEKCAATIARLASAGVNDLACLVDFGLDLDLTLASLQRLAELRPSLHGRLTAAAGAERGVRP